MHPVHLASVGPRAGVGGTHACACLLVLEHRDISPYLPISPHISLYLLVLEHHDARAHAQLQRRGRDAVLAQRARERLGLVVEGEVLPQRRAQLEQSPLVLAVGGLVVREELGGGGAEGGRVGHRVTQQRDGEGGELRAAHLVEQRDEARVALAEDRAEQHLRGARRAAVSARCSVANVGGEWSGGGEGGTGGGGGGGGEGGGEGQGEG